MNLNYAVEQRLRLLDFLLDHYGTVNRAALMDYFGISVAQASNDIQTYLAIAPTNATYDASAKTYRSTQGFVRVWP